MEQPQEIINNYSIYKYSNNNIIENEEKLYINNDNGLVKNYIFPPYEKKELKEFEEINNFKLPVQLFNYLTKVSRIIYKKNSINIYSYFQIYENDFYSEMINCNNVNKSITVYNYIRKYIDNKLDNVYNNKKYILYNNEKCKYINIKLAENIYNECDYLIYNSISNEWYFKISHVNIFNTDKKFKYIYKKILFNNYYNMSIYKEINDLRLCDRIYYRLLNFMDVKIYDNVINWYEL